MFDLGHHNSYPALSEIMPFPKFQFSIRRLLAATTVAAVVLAVCLARPAEYIDIDISESGSVSIAGVLTARSEIESRVQQEVQYRENWFQGSAAKITMPADQMSPASFQKTDWFNSLRDAGIDKFSIRPAEKF